ncbi:transposase [Paraburkholderia youngii]
MSAMRGIDEMQEPLFTTVKLDDFVPADHPLRPIRQLVNEALKRLNGLFSVIYADSGRASIAPEKLLRALLLQVFYSVRSERMLMEQMRYNLLFRWFVGLAIEDAVWDHSVFSKNRDRLLEHQVVEAFFTEVMSLADKRGLLSREHFSVDGTLIQAWASHKSFRAKDGSDDGPPAGGGRNADTDWKGKRRSNDTHESSTDADARLFKKSKKSPAILWLPRPHPDGEPLRAGGRRCGQSCGWFRRTGQRLAAARLRTGHACEDSGCGQGL